MKITTLLSAAVSAAIAIACASADVIYSSEAWEDQATGDLPATANNTDYLNTGDAIANVKIVGNLDDGNPGTIDPTGQHVRVAGNVNKHMTLTNSMALATDGAESLRVDFAIHFDKGGYTLANNVFELLYSASGDFTDAVVVQVFTTVDSGTIITGPYQYLQKTWYPGQSVKIDATALGITDTAKLRWRKGVGSNGSNSYVYLDDVIITSVPGAPQLDSTLPLAGAIGIQRNADLSLNFDEDVLAVTGKFITLHLPNGTPVEIIEATSATVSGRLVTIPLSTDLGLGNSYYVTVEPGAFTDLSANPIAGIADSGTWTFTTALADITYVDAEPGAAGNTFATGGSLEDISWVGPDLSSVNTTQWNQRLTVGGNGDPGDLYQGSTSSASLPELTTQISGLSDGIYKIWAFYWDQIADDTQNWGLSAGLVSGALTTYSSPGEPAVSGATPSGVINAGDLNFTSSVTVVGLSGDVVVRNLFGVDVGQVEVSGGTPVNVYLDNYLTTGSNNRAWYDGVGYQFIANPTSDDPRITSFSAVGGGVWELTLQGDANTKYEFRSSTTLDFTPGTLRSLTQANPGSDPGTVDGSGNFVTTDGSGLAKVRLTLTGPTRDFVRAQTMP